MACQHVLSIVCAAGFSQGSAVTLLLLAELAAQAPHLLPQFCILVRSLGALCAEAKLCTPRAQQEHISCLFRVLVLVAVSSSAIYHLTSCGMSCP